jgi:hypothetical protein
VGTLEEGESKDDKWITVAGGSNTKKLLQPKLKPTLHNAFAILSQPDDPTGYNMSRPLLKMDDDKTVLPLDPQEHRRQRKIARRQHITWTLRLLHDSDDLFLDNSITLAEDERTIMAKPAKATRNVWLSTLPTPSVARQTLVLPTWTQYCLQFGLRIQPDITKIN